MLQITEDTPPDMLAGAMDLSVHLPTGRTVKMSVERSTPMMDLLVQITTNNHLQLSGYTLQALGMAPSSDISDKILPFKPNTPIGALDTQHVRVIPKARTLSVSKNIPQGHQPFESTFRLKVHLPRNQLYVTRVSQSVHLEDIMRKVCEEKILDPLKYEFRHPGNLDEVLNPKLTLSDYQITEIYIVLKGTVSLNQAFSTSDIMALRKEEERKQMHNKTGGGVFNLIFRRGKSSTGSGSLSSENRSISPTQSDDSRSVTPPSLQPPIITPPPQMEPPTERPKPPQRKRRPAPKPPQLQQQQTEQEAKQQQQERKSSTASEPPPEVVEEVVSTTKKIDTNNGLTICHSRNSSDSSGYHEASVLSDNCNTSLPRRPKSSVINEEQVPQLSGLHSQSTSNLTKMAAQSKSTSSLAIQNRKKKSAPPPPPAVLKSADSVTSLEKPSPVVASQPQQTVAQPESIISTASFTQRHPLDSLASTLSSQSCDKPIPPPPLDEEAPKEPTAAVVQKDEPEDLDWQYQLPSPPKAFRDSSPVIFEKDVADSVVTSPELFEKLNDLNKRETSDMTSIVSEEPTVVEKPILNKLSLENLEKRKSLVYNRELATSLKMQEKQQQQPEETFSSSLTKFEKTYEEVSRRSSLQNKEQHTTNVSRSTLPNFKITTYDNPKKNIDIFEDDTIRSSNVSKRNSFVSPKRDSLSKSSMIGRSMENISFRKNSASSSDEQQEPRPSDSLYKFYKPQQNHVSKTNFVNVFRSESFSSDHWTPSKPVARSKSQVALNKAAEKATTETTDDGLSKSNSLFDVSGLQSLGVIRLIQNKLNTPSNSTEHLDKEIAKEPPKERPYQKPPEPKVETSPPEPQPQPKTYIPYRAPSINMGTWSDRPKIPIHVKDDPDYKFGSNKSDGLNSKLIVNTTHNDVKSSQSVEIKSNNNFTNGTTNNTSNNRVNVKVNGDSNVSIKVNGSEPISAQNAGNVVIKIGEPKPYRRPLGDVNKNQERPHSIAFGSDFDISRVPIVRSVEFKKPYRDSLQNGTSITQIYQNGGYKSNNFSNSVEHERKNGEVKAPPVEPKPSFRLNSFTQPVVRGFQANDLKSQQPSNNGRNEVIKRMSWGPHSFSTLPSKPPPRDFSTNKSVPFSQLNLRRTESTKLNEPPKPVNNPTPPPPPNPPLMPAKVRPTPRQEPPRADPKDQLLQAIRDFGGKKGLRPVRA